MSALLQIQNLGKQFGGLAALSNVSFEATEGNVTGLIGPNGAGKTTCFNLITGTLPPSSGKVVFQGAPITRLPPHRVVKHGLARTFQSANTFPKVSVRENILRAALLRHTMGPIALVLGGRAARAAIAAAETTVDNIMDAMDLAQHADREAGTLAYGHQKRLGVAIGLATQPKLLLLDEPAAGLNPEEVDRFGTMLMMLKDRFNLSVLIVEHHMRLIMRVCDHIVVLDHGEKIAEGNVTEVQSNPRVIEAYLGADTHVQ